MNSKWEVSCFITTGSGREYEIKEQFDDMLSAEEYMMYQSMWLDVITKLTEIKGEESV